MKEENYKGHIINAIKCTIDKYNDKQRYIEELIVSEQNKILEYIKDNRLKIKEIYPKFCEIYKIDIDEINFKYPWEKDGLEKGIHIFKVVQNKIKIIDEFKDLNLGYKNLWVLGDIYNIEMKIEKKNITVDIFGLIENPMNLKEEKYYNAIINNNSFDDKRTYIYIMYDYNTGYYKIGRSANPAVRERTLQSEKPTIDLIKCWIGTWDDEKILHRMFKHKRYRGEWFALNDNDIMMIKSYFKDNNEK